MAESEKKKKPSVAPQKQSASKTGSSEAKPNSKTETNTKTVRRLYRSEKNAVIGGVAAGLGEYFEIDPVIIRLIFVLATIFAGWGVIVYVILWIVLPQEQTGEIASHDTVQNNVAEIKDKAEKLADGLKSGSRDGKTRSVAGFILIALGIIFLLDNVGIFRSEFFWPLVLVVIGFIILRS